MIRPFRLAILAAGLFAAPALGQEQSSPLVPPFLEGGAVYARDIAYCPGKADPGEGAVEDTLSVSKAGLYGYELGCTFLQFLAERDPETKEIFSWQALAQCGDDSGVTRPDAFTLIADADGAELRVQSQNEYVAGTVAALMNEGDFDRFMQSQFLSGSYKLCP